jgi:hypothetical protein
MPSAAIVARLTPTGVLDNSFGYGGVVELSQLPEAITRDVAIDATGGIVAAVENATAEPVFSLFRVQGGGALAASGPPGDRDGDSIPDPLEPGEERDVLARDNDVFGSARLFAMQQYRDFLGREGDAGGVNFWTQQVDFGLPRSQVIENFFTSNEFQGSVAPVARLYFAYFLRYPDYGGLSFWTAYFRSGHTLADISAAFAQSPEFTNTYGPLDNGQFVTLVYNNVLGRQPDQSGYAFWKGRLDSRAMTRGEVMLAFSEGDEYRARSDSLVYVTMMYAGMLRREPDQAGFDFWVNYRNAGNSGQTLINGFLGSAEYRARFLP